MLVSLHGKSWRDNRKGERIMKQLKWILIGSSLVLWLGIVQTKFVVSATENGIGGQVNTTGKISFYEESGESSSTEFRESNAETPIKPLRKGLPSTGEQVRMYSYIGCLVLFIVLLILFLRKRRKEEKK